MKAARRHQIHENLGVPTGGRGTQGRGTRHFHQCMYSCRIWRMIRLWLEERLKPRTRASHQGNFFESSYDGGRGNFSDVSIEGRGNYSYSGHAFWSRGCSNSRRSIFSSFLSAKGRKTGASTSCRQRSHLLGGSGSWHPPKRSRRLRIWG